MRKTFLLFGLLNFSKIELSAQAPIQENFYITKAKIDAYYDSLRIVIGDSALRNDESGYVKYKEWINKWEPFAFLSAGDLFKVQKAADSAVKVNMNNPSSITSVTSNWIELGPFDQPLNSSSGTGVGIINFVIVDPNNLNFLFAGSPAGGLFYSSNAGLSWANAGTDKLPVIGAACAAIDPTPNSSNWFIATGDRNAIMAVSGYDLDGYNVSSGVYRNTTGLSFNWELIADANDLGACCINGANFAHWEIKKLLIDPSNNSIMYAATSYGIYVTHNALDIPASNVTWQKLPGTSDGNGGGMDDSFNDIEFLPNQSSTLFACRDFDDNASTPAHIIMSTNNGNTWVNFDNGINLNLVQRINIETSPINPNMLYVLTSTGNTNLYTLDISCCTIWTNKGNTGIAKPNSIQTLCVSPTVSSPNERILYGDINPIHRSANGGNSWTNSISSPHDDIRNITYTPDGLTLYAGCDGGVWKSTDQGDHWSVMNNGLAVETIYNMDGYTNPNNYTNIFLLGNQDCGTNFFDGSNWSHVFGGDGYMPMVDYNDPTHLYASSQNGYIGRSDNSGISFNNSAWAGNTSGNFVSDFRTFEIMNSADPSEIYQAGKEIWRTKNRGVQGTWFQISDFQNQFQQSLALQLYSAPSNPGYIYAFAKDLNTSAPLLYKTTKANDPSQPAVIASWTQITLPVNAWISCIAVDENDPEIIWVTFFGYNSPGFTDKKIWNYNGNTATWTNITAGLSDISVQSIVKEKGADGALYIGTGYGIYSGGIGVYYTNNKILSANPNNAWQPFNTGLSNAGISQLQINYTDNTIRAATFGRGLWYSELACPADIDLIETGAYSANDFKEAEHNILSDAVVSGDISMIYRAGNEIHLNPGFAVPNGSASNNYFHGFIHACDHSGNSFNRYAHNNKGGNFNTEESNLGIINAKSEKKKDFAEMRVQPNPNTGTFTLNILNSFNPENTVEISDVTGRKVFNKSRIKQQEILNLDLENGTYLIKYYDGINAHSQAIIINR